MLLVSRSWFGIPFLPRGPAGGITHRVAICVQKLESPEAVLETFRGVIFGDMLLGLFLFGDI